MRRPTARPLASSRLPQMTRIAADSVAGSSPKDVGDASLVRTSATRLEEIAATLTSDEQAVLEWLGDVRLATGFQIARRLWAAPRPTDARARSCRRTLTRLERLRVIERLSRRIGGVRGGSSSIVYGVGPAGRRILNRQRPVPALGEPGERFITHTLAITELLVRLHEATLAGQLEVLATETEPACWREFVGVGGRAVVLKPDGFLRIAAERDELLWFVEVDLATESSSTIRRKARRYLAHYASGTEQARSGAYPRVLWVVPDRRRAELLTEVLLALPAPSRDLFAIWLFEEAIGRLAAEVLV
jgi:hypothetical protein